ncbi:hypothetical protein [Cryobacterium sp. MLB-32]|uniref:hypothetical protein n=1 Tax=Cryobacterium sp. MLB-32 TaxID=1529318 RepID=UPI0012E02185|nr:hypothetical protein [Cryobacterium sp. MLB-32]
MTRDGLLILPGAIIGRADLTGPIVELASCDEYQLHEPAVIRLNDHAGIVVSRVVLRRGEHLHEYFVSTTYVFDDGGWCIAAQQRTPA